MNQRINPKPQLKYFNHVISILNFKDGVGGGRTASAVRMEGWQPSRHRPRSCWEAGMPHIGNEGPEMDWCLPGNCVGGGWRWFLVRIALRQVAEPRTATAVGIRKRMVAW